MPRIVLTVESVSADDLLELAGDVADELKFAVLDTASARAVRAQKGDMLSSFVLGPFSLYCDFRISVERGRRGDRELLIEWETPWWAGIFGVGRTAKAADGLADAIEDRIEEAGGRVDDRRKT